MGRESVRVVRSRGTRRTAIGSSGEVFGTYECCPARCGAGCACGRAKDNRWLMLQRNIAVSREEEEWSSIRYPVGLASRLSGWWLKKNLGREFWKLLATSFLFDSGMFVFFLLYNLYLLDLGFHEDFLGWTTSATACGTIIASLPGGFFTQRFGLRRTLMVCLSSVPIICALRATFISSFWLIALAFAGGVAFSLWAVALAPVVAQITDAKNRAFAFSVVFAAGIGFGVVAGVVGGYLPKLFLFLPSVHGDVGSKRAALLFACGVSALALWPASRLKFSAPCASEKRHYPRNSFAFRFFPALAVWTFATGAFGPFFNAYFSHHLGFAVERIGAIFASAQLVQVLAILAAPLVFRSCGMINGIVYTQLACAASLGWLAASHGGWLSAAAYAGYAGFHWMSEPGMYALLMSRVQESQRAGASAINVFVISVARAAAAAGAGVAFARFGYPLVMAVVVVVIFASACLFRFLLGDREKAPLGDVPEECRAA